MRQFLFHFCIGASILAMTAGCSGPQQAASLDSYLPATPSLKLSNAGIGNITSQTSYNKNVIAQSLPNLRIDTVKAINRGKLKWLIAGFENDLQQLQFEPSSKGNKIAKIHVVGQSAAGPQGQRIGMTFAEAGARRSTCKPGKGQWVGMAQCQQSGSQITYFYAIQGESATSGRLPTGPELDQAPLVRMIWNAV